MVGRLPGRQPPIVHMQASSLLRNATTLEDEALRTATPDRIASNQFKLRDALELAWPDQPAGDVILDAHSVIDNDQTLVPVEIAPIAATRPNGLIFLWDTPENIILRRSKDTRLRPTRNADEINIYQNLAWETCVTFATSIGVKLHRVQSGELEHFADATASILDRPLSS